MDIGEGGVMGNGLSGVLRLRARAGGSSSPEKEAKLRVCSKVIILSDSISVVARGVTGPTRDEDVVEEQSVYRRPVGRRGDRGGSGGDGRGSGLVPPSELAVSANWKS